MSKRNVLRSWGLVLCLLILAGCGGGESDDSAGDLAPARATDPTSVPTPAPAVVSLSEVIWTTAVDDDGEPVDSVDSFPANAPAIIAAVEVGQVPADSEITASWQIEGTDVPDAEMTVTADQDVEQGWVTFRFVRGGDQVFPLGLLEVTIEASDGTSVTGEIDIVLP